MSGETAQKLNEARAAETERRAEADDRIRECLTAVARGIPARVDEVGKKAAHDQPDVARELGVEGIKDLRRELADAAAVLASEVEAAAEQIKWPRQQSEYSQVKPRDIHSALFNFLYGQRVDSLASILKRHGFPIHDDNAQRSQSLILPQTLYSESDFAAVAEALSLLGIANRAVAAAKAADDRDVVDSLWDGE
jgi:hypothetical protein